MKSHTSIPGNVQATVADGAAVGVGAYVVVVAAVVVRAAVVVVEPFFNGILSGVFKF
jgi:hypothetical protein